MKQRIFLIGFMGAGKSTVGRLLAERLKTRFIDLDTRIASAAGLDVPAIFATEGEQGFRRRERAALSDVALEDGCVVACGGGVVTDDESRAMLRTAGEVVYLQVTAEEALARIGDVTGRPMLTASDAVSVTRDLLAARESLYRSVADLSIDTTGATPGEVVDRIVTTLAGAADVQGSER